MLTAKTQRTQRFNYFLFSDERPRNGGTTKKFLFIKGNHRKKEDRLDTGYLIVRATTFATYVKLQLVLDNVRSHSLPSTVCFYFWLINGKE